METTDRNTIKNNRDQLSRLINMNTLWPKLIEHGIFDKNYPEISKWQGNLNNKITKKRILDEIQTRGPHAYQNLIRSLEETDQDNCAQILAREQLTYNPANDVRPLKIKVKKSTSSNDFPTSDSLFDFYSMNSNPRGIALIMLLYNLNDETSKKCAECDEKNLIDLFHQMGFKVIIEKPITVTEIKQKAKEFSKNRELSHVDCAFFMVIGNNVQDTNHVKMNVKNSSRFITYGGLMHYFNGQNCPNLIQKPKIFVYHLYSSTCGDNTPISVEIDDDVESEFNLRDDSRSDITKKLRNYSDMLISFSLINDDTIGMTKNGSLYIQVLCEVFMKYAYSTHVTELFKKANERSKSLRGNNHHVSYFLKNLGFQHCFLNPEEFS